MTTKINEIKKLYLIFYSNLLNYDTVALKDID